MTLQIVPITQKEANAFVELHHRHHGPVVGSVFQIAVALGDDIVGVVIVGRPVSRIFDNGWTLEVNRCCTTGERNSCSMLYRAAWRVARELGYTRLITYTLPEEGGASLRGAGFRVVGQTAGGSWDRKIRPRVDTHPLQAKLRWELSA